MWIDRRKVEVEWFKYRAICDCGGELICMEDENEEVKEHNKHICNKCKKEEIIKEHQFPFVNSELVNDEPVGDGEVEYEIQQEANLSDLELVCNHCGHKFFVSDTNQSTICPMCKKNITTWEE